MFNWIGKSATSCFSPSSRSSRTNKDDDKDDPLLWSKDLERHSHGDFSIAVVQANAVLEDQSQVETGGDATFVGVYDGQGGTEASTYLSQHLCAHLLRLARENEAISEDIIRNAYSDTVDGFMARVRRDDGTIPKMGSCCMVGVIWKRALFVANLGDSEAVLGYLNETNKIEAETLSRPVLRSEPTITARNLGPNDKFIIFASVGLWEYMTDTEAVEIVNNNPRVGIAKRLIMAAIGRAARISKTPYKEIKKLEGGMRRQVHNDMTVVVVFFDHDMPGTSAAAAAAPAISVQGFVDTVGPSDFKFP